MGYQYMNTGIERRRHPRVPLVLPVVLMTPQGAIEGKTANISAGGLALILFLEPYWLQNTIWFKFQRIILHHSFVPQNPKERIIDIFWRRSIWRDGDEFPVPMEVGLGWLLVSSFKLGMVSTG